MKLESFTKLKLFKKAKTIFLIILLINFSKDELKRNPYLNEISFRHILNLNLPEYNNLNYVVEKLCGPKGGGFVVDPHTLHRGAVEGSLPRTGGVGEYHAVGKCAAMDALGLGLPCPSADQLLV